MIPMRKNRNGRKAVDMSIYTLRNRVDLRRGNDPPDRFLILLTSTS